MMGVVVLTVFSCSFLLTAAFRRYAFSSSVVDVPNDRSSHQTPTPRGGGMAIVTVFLIVILTMSLVGSLEVGAAIGLFVSGALVAAIGFVDDHQALSARLRLGVHFLAACWAVAWLTSEAGWGNLVLLIFGLVWLLNLYNFMDGINGLAGSEAVSVGLGAAWLSYLAGLSEQNVYLPLLLAVAAAGFLVWNFPVARIFMGDGGSGFLGVSFAGLALLAMQERGAFFHVWAILLGVFIVDASFTLLRRLLAGQKIYQAHRSHAYQRAAQHFGSHKPVTLVTLAINMFWLLPWAFGVALGRVDGWIGLILAYLPLLIIAIWLKAGTADILPVKS